MKIKRGYPKAIKTIMSLQAIFFIIFIILISIILLSLRTNNFIMLIVSELILALFLICSYLSFLYFNFKGRLLSAYAYYNFLFGKDISLNEAYNLSKKYYWDYIKFSTKFGSDYAVSYFNIFIKKFSSKNAYLVNLKTFFFDTFIGLEVFRLISTGEKFKPENLKKDVKLVQDNMNLIIKLSMFNIKNIIPVIYSFCLMFFLIIILSIFRLANLYIIVPTVLITLFVIIPIVSYILNNKYAKYTALIYNSIINQNKSSIKIFNKELDKYFVKKPKILIPILVLVIVFFSSPFIFQYNNILGTLVISSLFIIFPYVIRQILLFNIYHNIETFLGHKVSKN